MTDDLLPKQFLCTAFMILAVASSLLRLTPVEAFSLLSKHGGRRTFQGDARFSSSANDSPFAIGNVRRISRDDVDRLSRGLAAKAKGYGSRAVPHRLNEAEVREWEVARKRGYLEVSGTGRRRERKGSPLRNLHRQWCDALGRPQIVLLKAVGTMDAQHVVRDLLLVDLSPLRLPGMYTDLEVVETLANRYREQIQTAAIDHDMHFIADNVEELAESEDTEDAATILSQSLDWATLPIWRLPVVQAGELEGERSNAKRAAKQLAELWEIPEKTPRSVSAVLHRKGGGRTKMKTLSRHRSIQ